MASTQIIAGSIIRTPHTTALVLKDGSLRALRIDDRTWSKGGVRQEMPTWRDLDDFLKLAQPAWWTVEFKYPKDWFTEAHRQHRERVIALPRGETYFAASQKVWDETFGARRQAFLDEIVAPICAKYGLTRAADYDPNEVVFGSAGSPAARTAVEQLLEMEPDRTKWADRMWETSGSEHEHFRLRFCALYYRNESYERRKRAEEAKRLLEERKAQATTPVVPPLLMPLAPPPPAALLAPRVLATTVKISRQQLDMLLATGIKKVPDALWEQLSTC